MEPAKDKPATRRIEWTGERCVPWLGRLEVVYEHLHRYAFAASISAGKDVLDLGCGEGYGAALLAKRARRVVGVDSDSASIAHAREKYPRANLQFIQGSVLDLGQIADRSQDLAVCFEVIEHVAEQRQLVAEARRVLSNDGVLVVSTPDRSLYRHGEEPNPFHVRELDAQELRDLLRSQFDHVALWGQGAVVGSMLLARDPAGERLSLMTATLDGDHAGVLDESPGSVYLIAVASNVYPLPDLASGSFLVDPAALEPLHHAQEIEREAQRLRGEIMAIKATRGWRLLAGARALRDRVVHRRPS